MSPTLPLQIVFDALLLIGVYAIGALGFALIWGVLNLLNLAHGSFIMLGAYTTFLLWRAGLDPLVALVPAMLIMFGFGWMLQHYVLDFMVNGPHSPSIALTFGVNLMLMGAALRLFTARYRSIIASPRMATRWSSSAWAVSWSRRLSPSRSACGSRS